ncbi:hypothetical protein ACROYT_G010847 [Oculina patagonica]
MSFTKHRSKGRGGGGRGQRNYRPGSSASPPLQTINFANLEDGFNTDIYLNKLMVYYVTSNLGETARVVVRNGDIYEGILKAVSPKFDCTLGEAHLVQQKKSNGLIIEDERIVPNRERLISNLLIALKDIVSVNITKTEEPEIAPSIDSFTDEAIAAAQKHTNGQIVERPLQKWIPQDEELDLGGGLEDNVKVNGWSADEMFKTNQEKFGVTSTYSDDLLQYTTPLPKDSTREMELKAEQTAREIEQSRGHILRQEVDSGRTEEEAFAAVVRPQTTSAASKTSQAAPGHSYAEGKSQRGATEAVPPAAMPSDERKTPCTDTQTASLNTKSTSAAPVQFTAKSIETASTNKPAEQAVKPSPTVDGGASEVQPSASSKSDHRDVMKDLKEFHSNFTLGEKPSKKPKEVQPAESDRVEAATVSKAATLPNTEPMPPAPDVEKTDDKKTPKNAEDSILTKSKLNPNAKEFKFTPKKPAPSPQPQQYMVAAPFSPTSIRPHLTHNPFPPPQQVMMVTPQQYNVYRGKQPFNKPARGQSYGGREQGESPPFISAAAATGSPIIAPGGNTFPQQVYQLPSQPVAYVQSPAGMVPQQVMQQYVVPGHGPPRFIAPVSSPAGGAAVPMSQAYQDGTHVPVYVTGNMAPMQSAGTPQGQPQPSPSQQGQFIFTPMPQMPGQPQATGPHQGQVTPGPAQFGQSPLVYIPQVPPNASVPTSASSSVPYMPGNFHGDRIQ